MHQPEVGPGGVEAHVVDLLGQVGDVEERVELQRHLVERVQGVFVGSAPSYVSAFSLINASIHPGIEMADAYDCLLQMAETG